jgi:hypothetical protein
MNITEFTKTATFIFTTDDTGHQEFIDREEFEAYVDRNDARIVSYPNADSEYDQEDSYQQTWDQYYKDENTLIDLGSFITFKQRTRKIMQPLNNITESYTLQP